MLFLCRETEGGEGMKLVLRPVCIRKGEDGYWRICTPMFGEYVWVQGRFHRYADAREALLAMNAERLARLFSGQSTGGSPE